VRDSEERGPGKLTSPAHRTLLLAESVSQRSVATLRSSLELEHCCEVLARVRTISQREVAGRTRAMRFANSSGLATTGTAWDPAAAICGGNTCSVNTSVLVTPLRLSVTILRE